MNIENKKSKGKLESLKDGMKLLFEPLVGSMVNMLYDLLIFILECCGYVMSLASRIYSYIAGILTKTRRAVYSWVTRKKTTK